MPPLPPFLSASLYFLYSRTHKRAHTLCLTPAPFLFLSLFFLCPSLVSHSHTHTHTHTHAHTETQNAYFCATVTQSPIATQTALILNQTAVSPASRQQPVPPPHPPHPISLSPQAGSLSALCRMEGIFPLGRRHGLALNQL